VAVSPGRACSELPPRPQVAVDNGLSVVVFEDDFTDGQLHPAWKRQDRTEAPMGLEYHLRPPAVTFQRTLRPNDPQQLVILTYHEGSGRSRRYVTGGIDTRPRPEDRVPHVGFEHRYGYIEARIRFQSQPGHGSAFWLNSRWNKPTNWRGLPPEQTQNLPVLNNNDADFTANFGNEVDIVECMKHHTPVSSQRNLCGPKIDGEKIDASRCLIMNIHWGGGPQPTNQVHQALGRHVATASPLIGEYHTYGLLWTPRQYRFYFDGQLMWQTDPDTETFVVSQRPEFLLLTSGVGNNDFLGAPPANGFGARESTNAKMEVEWVRWWSDKPAVAPSRN
jgi:hypothetical protein